MTEYLFIKIPFFNENDYKSSTYLLKIARRERDSNFQIFSSGINRSNWNKQNLQFSITKEL